MASAAKSPLEHGPLLGKVPPIPPTGRSPKALDSAGPLLYHGGPVMHRSTTYAIFWTGPTQAVPPAFEAGIAQFLEQVAAASGSHTNVYSVPVEYSDTSAVAAYDSQFGGALQDTAPLPTAGCAGPLGDPCVSSEQIREQLDGFIAANQLPRGLSSLYLVFLPPGYDTCGPANCAYTSFCGYHDWFNWGRTLTLYAVFPWMGPNCAGSYSPNGFPALDTAALIISHEEIEAATDPLHSAWFDTQGEEIGDKCAWLYGPPLGSTLFDAFNQQIGSGQYALQLEWSNAASGCVGGSNASPPPPPANDLFANAQALTGQTAERSGDTTFEAGKEPGEPNHAGNEGGGSIWYRWTAPKLGTATVDTFGSNFDTLLGVYTGPAVSQLTEIGSNDNSGFGDKSKIRFIARPGTTYRIAVDGYNESGEPTGGSVQLHLAEQPAPNTRISGSHRIATRSHRALVRFNLQSRPRAAGFECSLDRLPFQRCRRHPAFAAGIGTHLLRARAFSPGGLRDPQPASFAFAVARR